MVPLNKAILAIITLGIIYSCNLVNETRSGKKSARVAKYDSMPGDLDIVRKNLGSATFSYEEVSGIGHEEGCTRRDPSDVIKVDDTWYVWYTKVYGRSPGYWGTIW